MELQDGGDDDDDDDMISVDDDDSSAGDEPEFSQMTVEQLKNALNEVLAAEDYESAAKIRDEINKRK